MQSLLPAAARIGARLKARGETIGVCESSIGGLLSASLLAVPGASAYFISGAVVYTRAGGDALLAIPPAAREGLRASTEPYALLMARTIRARLGTSWGSAETGASGPTGNRYGDAAGHACIAIVGPVEKSITVETGSPDRIANMRAFAAAALELLERNLSA
ncbi:MAG: CinA family protein [Alphaproteobacteria bacterium]|nr:CinA family protein [Alphaproteobacteria bacterium]